MPLARFHLARAFGLATTGLAILPLAAHAYQGTFSRYLADDFCTADSLARMGFVPSQAHWYLTWSGRYMSTLMISLAQSVGPRLTPWLPSLVLLAWVAAGLYLAHRLHTVGAPTAWAVGLPLVTLHAFATLEGAPSVYQSLYWQTGMVTYLLPLILLLVYGGWLWPLAIGRAHPRVLGAGCMLSLGSAFLLGGFSETYVALQTSVLGLGLLLVWTLSGRGGRLRGSALVGCGLAGSILSGLALALAPGTQVRIGLMPPRPDAARLIEATLRDGYLFLARTVKEMPEGIALAILIPLLLILLHNSREATLAKEGDASRRKMALALVILPVLTPLLMLSTIAPYEYAISSYPDARVLVAPVFTLIGGLVLWGACLGRLLAQLVAPWPTRANVLVIALAAAAVAALATASVRETSEILGTVEVSRAYAESWDTRDMRLRQARAAGLESVAAASLRHMGGLAEIGRDPNEWINRCVAGTYGLGAVVAK